MKKTILIAALSALMALPALAQNNNPKSDQKMDQQKDSPEMRAQKMTDDMTRDLNLRPDQKKAVYEANLKMTTAHRDATQVTPDIARQRDADLQKILDEDQYQMYMEKRKKEMEGQPAMEPAKRSAPRSNKAEDRKIK